MEHSHPIAHLKTDYSVHLAKALSYPFQVGIISLLIGGIIIYVLQSYLLIAGILAGLCLVAGGGYVAFTSMIKKYTNVDRRLKDREEFLNNIHWKGSETVLDVGCGNGILLMVAAKRLTSGKGIGVDIWTEFSGGHRPDTFHKNANAEGVTDKVDLQNEDVRNLPYANESFDVIISGLVMHHIAHGKDTKNAMSEMFRVLKPGGKIALYDVPFVIGVCAKLMRKNGMIVEKKEKQMLYGVKK